MTRAEKTGTRSSTTPAPPAPVATIALVAGILAIPGAVAGLLGLILPVIAIAVAVVSLRNGERARKRWIFAVALALVGALLAVASAAIGHYIVG